MIAIFVIMGVCLCDNINDTKDNGKPEIMQEGKKSVFTLTKENQLQVGLLPIPQTSYSIFGSLTFKFFSSSKNVYPYVKLVMDEKDPVASYFSYDFLCSNWTNVTLGNIGELGELSALTKDLGLDLGDSFLRGYQCEFTYKQYSFKPGVYTLSLFYNHSSSFPDEKKGKGGKDKKKDSMKRANDFLKQMQNSKDKKMDFSSFAEELGVTVEVTAFVDVDVFSLMSAIICFALTSSAWAFAECTHTIDVFMILLVIFQLGAMAYYEQQLGVPFFRSVAMLLTVFITPYAVIPLLFPVHSVVMHFCKKKKYKYTNVLKYVREVILLVTLSLISMYTLLSLLHLHTRLYLLLACLSFATVGNLIGYVVHVRRRGTRKSSSDEIDFDMLRDERRRSVMDILRRGELKIRRERKAKRARVRALLLKRQKRQERATKGLKKKRHLFGFDNDSTSEDEAELDKLLHHSGYLGTSSSEEEETGDDEEDDEKKKDGEDVDGEDGKTKDLKDAKEENGEKSEEKNRDQNLEKEIEVIKGKVEEE